MKKWALIFAAGLVGWLAIYGLFLLYLQVVLFFDPLAPRAQADVANPVQNTVYHFLGEKLHAPGAGMTLCNEILIEAHEACPNRLEGI
jgi:hypothetical protein